MFCVASKLAVVAHWWLLFLVTPMGIASMPAECNGLSSLCSVKVSDSYFAMVHNAMSAVENGFIVAANHIEDPIVAALDAGYRGLNLDLCNCNGSLQFCHGNDIVGCGVGRVDPIAAFIEINNWIAANPTNVILISIQINEDADESISLEMIQQLLQQVPDGFIDRLYDHWPIESSKEWPTLAELIESNKQVLFFYFKGPDGTGNHLTGLNYWYDFAMETGWQWESVAELESTLLPNCPITRGIDSTGDFFSIEAFVTEKGLFGLQFQPSQESAQQINTVDWAGRVLDACFDAHRFPATIVSVDFWSEGNLPTLMQERNALLLGSPTGSSTLTPSSTSPAPSVRQTTQFPTFMPATSIPTPSPSSMPSPSLTQLLEQQQSNSPISSTRNETNADLCQVKTPDGEVVFLKNGQSFGDYLTTRCISPEEYPCFCNPVLPGQIECPYCGFPSRDDEMGEPTLYCARHNETVEIFVDSTVFHTCTCQIPENPRDDPVSSCQTGRLPPTRASGESPMLVQETPNMPAASSSTTINTVQSEASGSGTTRFRAILHLSYVILGSFLLQMHFL